MLAVAVALGAFSCEAFAQATPAPAGPQFAVKGYRIEGDNPLGNARAQEILAPFAGAAVGLDRLQAAAEALEKALHDAGFGFYRVILPPQESGDVVALKVLAFTLGQVTVKGHQFFGEPNIRASLPALRENASPNTFTLARDLALANENPSKRVVAAFRPGEKPDTLDANLEVTDSRPLSGFAQLANTGTAATGISRLTFGASHANLFDLDHQITATYTVSPENLPAVKQWGVFYRAPVYGIGGMVSAYWTESNVSSGTAAGVNITGGGRFAGIQYTQYFAPRGDYRDYFTISFDDKQFNNNITITGAGGAGAAVNPCARIASRPLSGSYSGRYEGADLTLSFNGDYVRNFPGGTRNAQADYDACNPPADPSKNLTAAWSMLRLGADAGWRLAGDWLLAGRVRSQFTGNALIAGEKFGVGGAQSVRALGERALAGDTGVSGSIELWTPPMWQGIRWLAFYDTGRVKTLQPAPGSLSYEGVASAGFGMRWQYKTQLSLALDYGVVVAGNSPNANVTNLQNVRGHDRLHLNLVMRF